MSSWSSRIFRRNKRRPSGLSGGGSRCNRKKIIIKVLLLLHVCACASACSREINRNFLAIQNNPENRNKPPLITGRGNEMEDDNEVYDDMNLYITPESFIVEPNGTGEVLIIGRHDKVTRVQPTGGQLANLRPTRRICGVLGTIHLLSCDYLLVATHRLFVGVLNGAIVWRLAGYDIIPYIPNAIQRKENETYLQMLRKTLDTKYFYFSYRYDLTHTMQRRRELLGQPQRLGLLQRADPRFVWNGHVLQQFHCDKMEKFQLPLIHGFVSVNQVQINGQTFFWSIVTRRSVQRAGTRLFCRGIDDEGHVANFVETEQIVEFNGQHTSFVQTRGSMPFHWHQLPNLRYKPRPRLIPGKDHLAACATHFRDQVQLYGAQVAVNLVDQKGAEGELEATFQRLVRELANPNVKYEAFDFHHECRKMRWDRLNILIDRLAHDTERFAFYHSFDDGRLVSTQTGVFRTNCIDCLDRTNVVQSMLARRSLTSVLQKLGVLHVGQPVEQASRSFEDLFKGVWADNADLISLQYSGTGALKTDFTRTGKRTKAGALQDGKNSMIRYYLNNFADGQRQDGIDLFLGHYLINDNEGGALPSPLEWRRGWRFFAFPSVLLMAVAMFMITLTYPAEFNTENLLFMLFWGAMVAVSATGILHYGVEFVQWPRLLPPVAFRGA
ncbi:phosphatidylinositide phosphatase SAC1 isoform X1 [Drosophila pseudoobscura]|uniref:Phosphatidylinositol-3-phosphatase SAC1 n=2 Tax=Drosophila pseudoobscura pseudoobscura TaxID=46245 RepID=A0A6I8VLP1_DROPS|nr:phosphatidylinositide phosphatase SAC1 isoform X1 [Drosophila pseudoobscura]